jgi:hypothetical protein
MKKWKHALCIVALAVPGSTALAQAPDLSDIELDAAEDSPTPNDEVEVASLVALPVFASMDRVDLSSRWLISMSGVSLKEIGNDFDAYRVDLFGQLSRGNWGGFVQLFHARTNEIPYIVSIRANDYRYDQQVMNPTGSSSIELGAVYGRSFLGGKLELLGRLGFTLPTAANNEASTVATYLTANARLTDAMLAATQAATLRPSLSLRGRYAHYFWRADLGVDIGFDRSSEGDTVRPEKDTMAYGRMNAGAGVDLGDTVLTAESANLVLLNSEQEEKFFHTTTFSVQGRIAKRFFPYVALGVLLDADFGDVLMSTAGVQAQL